MTQASRLVREDGGARTPAVLRNLGQSGNAHPSHRCTSREGETMRVFVAATALPFVVLGLVSSASGQADGCERVVVEVSTPEHATHSGRFYQVGTSLEGTPLLKTDGGLCLQFVEGGSAREEEQPPLLLHVGAHAAADGEPRDESLDFDMSDVSEEEEPVFRRSIAATCGHWVIGRMGTADAALYPMIKVSDCARHPAFINEDSVWFGQECLDCEERSTIGKVTVTTERCPCSNKTFERTSQAQAMTTHVAADLNLPSVARTENNRSPARNNEVTVPTPVPTLAAPVNETSSSPGVVSGDDVTTSDASSVIEGGDIAVGVSLGVGAAVLLIAGMVAFQMRTFLCARAG
ncbi:expressed unknown protein [Ectocarpus siliculosus]|uniref:Uncharacterized protein n=1 Tax=Ectocarpus siliculosus TaxID=2880 RepID=D7FH60_ECTSI|nr:expressed unknown protein [Ectocarpus siliculosus]|eukprot:CBJ28435.1 expressed unknown protein [Ectocarpus siliculosus]